MSLFAKKRMPPSLRSIGRRRPKKKKAKAVRRRRSPGPTKIRRWIRLEIPRGASLAELKAWGSRHSVRGNPPAFVSDEAAWERAKKIVRPHWKNYEHPWAVVAHVYRRLTHSG